MINKNISENLIYNYESYINIIFNKIILKLY
jgi:hypothetical protein